MRPDNRKNDECRKIEAKVGIIEKADGSAMFRIGDTIAISAVYGPKPVLPRHMEDPEKLVVKCFYDMYSFSVPDRKRPGPDRRSIEISMVVRNALLPAIFLKEYPKSQVEVYVSIIQANAGTRCAGISAAAMALADAGISMRDIVSSVAVGRINDEIVVDLSKEEEDIANATDIPIAYMPRMDKFTLLQLDGKMPASDIKAALELAKKSCREISEIQKNALKEKYSKNEKNESEN